MTSSPRPNNPDLLELAALDAFGLLDEFEAEQFNRSFHEAPVPLQRKIVDLQTALVTDESLLPDESLPSELRTRVLAAVSTAIEEESGRFAPLATIGRNRRVDRRSYNALVNGRSSYYWRAASFVLAAVAIATLYFGFSMYKDAKTISHLALNQNTAEDLKTYLGPTFEDFAGNPRVTWTALTKTFPHQNGHVDVLVNDETGDVFVAAWGLPEIDGPYEFRARNGSDVTVLASLNVSGAVAALRLDDVAESMLSTAVWELTDSRGTVLFTSA
jgi:hypothetical protein